MVPLNHVSSASQKIEIRAPARSPSSAGCDVDGAAAAAFLFRGAVLETVTNADGGARGRLNPRPPLVAPSATALT